MTPEKNQSFFKQLKQLWLGLGNPLRILSLVMALIVVSTVTLAVQYQQELRKKAAGLPNEASLSLVASDTNLQVGETTTASIYLLNPSLSPITGIDVVLSFDQTILQLNSIIPNLDANFKTFLPTVGGSFDTLGVIDEANASGQIKLGATTFDLANGDLTWPVEENNVLLAQLEFEASAEGSTSLDFDFDTSREGMAAEMEDCNVMTHTVDLADDILGAADTVAVVVGSGGGPSPSPGEGEPTSCPSRCSGNKEMEMEGCSCSGGMQKGFAQGASGGGCASCGGGSPQEVPQRSLQGATPGLGGQGQQGPGGQCGGGCQCQVTLCQGGRFYLWMKVRTRDRGRMRMGGRQGQDFSVPDTRGQWQWMQVGAPMELNSGSQQVGFSIPPGGCQGCQVDKLLLTQNPMYRP